MKTLLLLRHAHAENLMPGSSDSERALTGAGRSQARELGLYLREHAVAIDLALSSNARRTQETTELIIATGALAAVRYEQAMYEASRADLLGLVRKTQDPIGSLLLVGHNPGLEDFAQLLTKRTVSMSTCTLATIKLTVDKWSDVDEDAGDLEGILRTGDLH